MRVHKRSNFYLFIVSGFVMLSMVWLFSTINPAVVKAAGNINGTVFRDFNANGLNDLNERGIAGITVHAYDASGVIQGTAISDANGDYALSAGGSGPYRVEFSGWPSYLQPAAQGSDNGSSVQFVADGNSTVHFALANPSDYSQPNPLVAVSRMNNGQSTATGNEAIAGVVTFNYENTGHAGQAGYLTPNTGALVPDVGTVWGNVYQRESQFLYTSTFLRRHAGMANGPGYVYLLDYSAGPTNTPLVKLNLQGISPANGGAAIDLGSVCRNSPNGGPDNASCVANGTGIASDYELATVATGLSIDLDAFGKVGLISFGGIDISEDENTLWLVNLQQRGLISIDVSAVDNTDDASFAASIGDVNQYLLTDINGLPACSNGEFRPWAINFHDGYGYLGGVCSGENETTMVNTPPNPDLNTNILRRTNANISAHVLRFDATNPLAGFTEVVQFPLNHLREGHANGGLGVNTAIWQPWALEWSHFANMTVGNSVYASYAQPILSDIEFADDGSMILGFADRLSLQLGLLNRGAFSQANRDYSSASAGDIIRVCADGSNWVVEGMAASCPVNEPYHANMKQNDGPSGTGEFFYNDFFADHRETAQGGLAYLPGSGQIMSLVMDPTRIGAGGVRRFNTTTAATEGNYEIYVGSFGNISTMYKSSGLGDIEVLRAPAPVEVGNRVWYDLNNNGLQDADELPVIGATVNLYAPDGTTLLASALTDSNGSYYFSNASGTSTANAIYNIAGLTTNTANFQIRLDNPADYAAGGPLAEYVLTIPDVQTGDTDASGDISDSDGTLANPNAPIGTGNYPNKTFATGAAGYNNHTYDFGFSLLYSLGNRVWFDPNNNGLIDAGEQGIDGVVVDLYADANGDGLPDSSTPLASMATADGGYYRFDNLYAGNYVVQLNPSNFVGTGALVGYTSSTPTQANPNTDSDSDDNGIDNPNPAANGIRSGSITLGPTEPLNESDLSPTGQGNADARANMTVDFGFYLTYSLGNRVWFDPNNNGLIDAGEQGIDGVVVDLYADANGDGLPDSSTPLASMATADGGYYRFDELLAGNYVVQLNPSNFVGAGALVRYTSSTPTQANPNTDSDSDDNGIDNPNPAANGIRSGSVTLGPTEPLNESDLSQTGQGNADARANMTVDFGFYVVTPTAISLDFFQANNTGQNIILSWQTALELNTRGFHIYRGLSPKQTDAQRITDSLIMAKSANGASYSWLDSSAKTNQEYYYWLVEHELNGNTYIYGPAQVTLSSSNSTYTMFMPFISR